MRVRISALGALAAAMPMQAFAHHVMDGKSPSTLVEGLLSGLGHPVIELSHLAAILLVGLVAARLSAGLVPIAAFVIGSFFGTLGAIATAAFHVEETIVFVSVALLALLLLARGPRSVIAMCLFAIGLVHGAAFAESIVGAERSPLAAYLLGLAVAELAIAGAACLIASRLRDIAKV